MPNNEEIIIKFKPEGDAKLIKAINKLATAQDKLNNSSEKAKKQFSKVNAKALKMIGTFKNNKDAIEKLGLSQKILTKALRGNADAVALVTARYDVFTGKTKKARKHLRILGGTISVLRSKLLVLSFALGMVTRGLGKFINRAGDTAEILNKFDVAFAGSANNLDNFLQALSNATGRSVHELRDLASNLGSILIPMGLTAQESATLSSELIQVATDMSSLKNIPVADVMRDFNSAMVGNSETVLKYGINVKEGELKLEAFRMGFTKTVRDLTENEKVFMRYTVLIKDSAIAEGDAIKTNKSYNNQLVKFKTHIDNLTIAIGGGLLPVANSMLNIFTDFNIKRVIAYGSALLGLAYASGALATAIGVLHTAMISLVKFTRKNWWGVILFGLFVVAEKMGFLSSETENLEEVLGKAGDRMGEVTKDMFDFGQKTHQTAKEVQNLNNIILQTLSAKGKGDILQLRLNDATNEEIALAQIKAQEDELAAKRAIDLGEQDVEKRHKLMELNDETFTNLQLEKSLIKEQSKDAHLKARIKGVGDIGNAMVVLAKGNKEQATMGLRLAQASAIADAIAGSMKMFKEGGLTGFIGGTALLATGMARVQQINAQIAEVNAVQPPKYATGGLVGGRRHSAGGTMIEAERGEFVMSRNAVESVGIEAMNRINAGGGGGSVNISFAGNVMSQDFIEDEAIPMIKEAIRRGADIGVA